MNLRFIVDEWVRNHPILSKNYECDTDDNYPAIYINKISGHSYSVAFVRANEVYLKMMHVKIEHKYISAADPQFFEKLERYLVDYLNYNDVWIGHNALI